MVLYMSNHESRDVALRFFGCRQEPDASIVVRDWNAPRMARSFLIATTERTAGNLSSTHTAPHIVNAGSIGRDTVWFKMFDYGGYSQQSSGMQAPPPRRSHLSPPLTTRIIA
jgi:hypothetical protein